MGIYDREYVRMGPHSRSGLGSVQFISFNSWLIIANVAVFVIGAFLSGMARPVMTGQSIHPDAVHRALVVDRFPSPLPPAGGGFVVGVFDRETGQPVGTRRFSMMTPLDEFGHFSTARGFFAMQVWRLITFQFLHSGIWHLVFNMLGLWIFGGMVEQYLGRKRYAAFYLTCGIAGGVSYLFLNLLGAGLGLQLPGVLVNDPWTPLVGASAGVFGVIMACAFIAPNAVVLVYFIPMKLKFMAYGYVALAAYNLLSGGNNAGGDAAHIGGAIAGFFFIRNAHLLRDFFDVLGDSRKPGRARQRSPRSPVNHAEVDRILSKVHEEGLRSLSEREKAVLREASSRGRGSSS
ncbi:MAG: rhomboid family intramembrane serine protease [Phycisphaeraceae bacterium]|nr:rhomboid family intramembrane serine protease [Phycisphaeraceae bacterium]